MTSIGITKSRFLSTCIASVAAFSINKAAQATDVYWDINGATAGNGSATPAGTWSTSTASWSTDSTGSSATQVWNNANGDNAIFSAGSDATGAFTSTVTGGVTVGNITQNIGKVLLGTGASGAITLSGASIITTTRGASGDFDLRVNPVISGTGASITKQGNGILLLEATNTYTGGTTLNAGTLSFENAGAFGAGAITLNGGNLVRNFGAADVTVANSLSVTGSTNVATIQQASNVIFSGTWGAGSTSGNFNVANVSVNGFSPMNGSVQITGDTSAYTGTISQNSVSTGERIRFGTAATNQTLGGSSLTISTSGLTTGGLSVDVADGGSGTFNIGALTGTGGQIRAGYNAAAATTFKIGALGTDTVYSGSIQTNGTGVANVEKVGGGTLTLNGANTYTGTTTVSGGTLLVNYSHSNAGAYSVNTGTLGGNGTITSTSAVTLGAAGKLSPGSAANTVNTLTLAGAGGLNLSAGVAAETGELLFNLDTVATSDQIALTNGTLNIGSGLNFADFAFTATANVTAGNVYTLFASTSAIGGSLDTTAANLTGLLSPGLNGTVGLSGNNVILSVTSVPEPASLSILAIGYGALYRRRRSLR